MFAKFLSRLRERKRERFVTIKPPWMWWGYMNRHGVMTIEGEKDIGPAEPGKLIYLPKGFTGTNIIIYMGEQQIQEYLKSKVRM